MTMVAVLTGVALALSGCGDGQGLDWDLRPSERFSTSSAARDVSGSRPQPDARGIISYPGYQVAVARRGDRVEDIAQRLGISPRELAAHNAIEPTTVLRGGELLVLPNRIDGAAAAPGAITATPLTPMPSAGPEPVQHTVRRGETAFSIARLYDVSPRSLSEWNGLDGSMSVREGQILMIPVAQQQTAEASAPLATTDAPLSAVTPPAATTTLPGEGSATPVPPSASQPLPATTPAPAGQGASAATPAPAPVADLGSERTSGPQLAMPVQGRIIRAYSRGRNDGIGIGAPAGTPVTAAAGGTVAAITRDTDQVPILVIRHQNNLLTVYANIDDIRVARGDTITRGQTIATVRRGDPSFLHFEVREGFESVDPMPYLQ
ncbi:peptidoglycan DD-metalloendopeptidase family protein [Pararhodobacter sp.]|uniref:peptidoglycan DD-metalloendopeptidase family protein n=1 Tax=Pararhodobacter sp. TaxID=2127056 RepID=UPI002AFE2A1D|nr:peptidoglycan DD-metalloendopeptidase family protein [Pararhodobacter sp.]